MRFFFSIWFLRSRFYFLNDPDVHTHWEIWVLETLWRSLNFNVIFNEESKKINIFCTKNHRSARKEPPSWSIHVRTQNWGATTHSWAQNWGVITHRPRRTYEVVHKNWVQKNTSSLKKVVFLWRWWGTTSSGVPSPHLADLWGRGSKIQLFANVI